MPHKLERDSKMTGKITLLVNDVPIGLSYFAQEFIEHTVDGMMAPLEGTGEMETLDISVEGDAVKINLNNAPVPTNQFVSKVFKNIMVGIVSSLKGVSEINKIHLNVKRDKPSQKLS